MAALLEALGHSATCVSDPRKAAEAANAISPDVALLDIGMPHVNGHELASNLRGTFGEAIYLVAITGYGDLSDHRVKGRKAGFDVFLPKPATLDMLKAIFEQVRARR